MDAPRPLGLLRQGLQDLVVAVLRGSDGHSGTVVIAYAIHEEQLVATLETEHTQGVHCLVGGQFFLRWGIRDVEISDFFHYD